MEKNLAGKFCIMLYFKATMSQLNINSTFESTQLWDKMLIRSQYLGLLNVYMKKYIEIE